jgi:hypothetical protein
MTAETRASDAGGTATVTLLEAVAWLGEMVYNYKLILGGFACVLVCACVCVGVACVCVCACVGVGGGGVMQSWLAVRIGLGLRLQPHA